MGIPGVPLKDAALHDLDTWLERAQNEEADSAGDRQGMDGSQGMGGSHSLGLQGSRVVGWG